MKTITTIFLTLCALCLPLLGLAQAGLLDPSFGTGGIQILEPSTFHDVGHAVITLDDNTLLVAGLTYPDGEGTGAAGFVGHLQENGSVDVSFGSNSGYTFLDAGEESYLYDIALAPDGSIYGCGTAYPTFAQQVILLVHLLADGTPDPAFGTGGMIVTALGAVDAEAQSLVIQDDGKVVLAGRAGFGDMTDAILLRYKPDGALDNTFGNAGVFRSSAYAGTADELWAVDLLDDGSIVAAGDATINFVYRSIVMRLDPDGTSTAGFGTNGVIEPDLIGIEDQAWGILAVGPRFFITGYQAASPDERDVFLAGFSGDGTPLASFGTGGVATTDVNVNEIGFDIARQEDGKLLVCGTSGQFGSGTARDFFLARYTSAGLADATFGTDGVVITSIDVDFDDANALAIQPDGKIVAVGSTAGFTSNTNNDLALVRYLSDGSTGITETTYGPGNFGLFPNPTINGMVSLSFNGPAPTDVDLFDAQGRLVPHPLTVLKNARSIALDLHDVNPGAYFVEVQQNGIRTSLPLMIAH